ncbi:oligosaccharide translocation protein RFT1, variant [Thozetella sp. PMI_491]|nr:oligosaccharide translocation protein RFT1, variant [Thozetella sp. PMI_491]
MDGQNRAVRGASLLILLQVVSRAITFVANQVLLRFLTAQLLGISTQLEVYYLSVLFFARESLRVAIQRQGGDAEGGTGRDAAAARARSTQAVVNLGYISIVLGAAVALVFGWLYRSAVSAETTAAAPYLELSLYIYGAAAVVELLSEPAFVLMQIRLQFGTRAAAESIATFLRCALTLGSAVWAARAGLELGVLPFALGQIAYGVGLWAVYGWYGLSLARSEGFSLFPKRVSAGEPAPARPNDGAGSFVLGYFYQPTVQLASSMMAQSIVKHILTQGDTFLVSTFSTPTAQGVYALANNYGGLAARLVFQPIEESSRSYFSRLLSTPAAGEAEADRKQAANKASSDLQALLKIYALLSLVVTTLGPTAAPLLLSLVAGPRWASSGAGECLAAYMWYIPLLAINGVAEAFVSSVATQTEVHIQSAWMTAFSLGFAGAGFLFLRLLDLGAIGLVIANSINMLCRIIWCAVFISGYFKKAGVAFDVIQIMPGPFTFLAAVLTSQGAKRVVLSGADAVPSIKETIFELVKIAGVALPFLGVILFAERQFLLRGYHAIARRSGGGS